MIFTAPASKKRWANIERHLREYGPAALLLLSLALLWELSVAWGQLPAWVLPPPSQIATTLRETWPALLAHVWRTMQAVFMGLALALTAGLFLATLIDGSAWLRRALYPLIVASQTIPILALAPLLIIWFGFGLTPKVLIVALFCFFPIAINTADGLSAADPDYLSLLQAMGATRYQQWRKVRLPAAMPYFFSGLKIAATYSVVGAIIGEWVGASEGLGIFMLRSANAFNTAQVFAAIAISSIISLLLFTLVYLIELKLLPWHHGTNSN